MPRGPPAPIKSERFEMLVDPAIEWGFITPAPIIRGRGYYIHRPGPQRHMVVAGRRSGKTRAAAVLATTRRPSNATLRAPSIILRQRLRREPHGRAGAAGSFASHKLQRLPFAFRPALTCDDPLPWTMRRTTVSCLFVTRSTAELPWKLRRSSAVPCSRCGRLTAGGIRLSALSLVAEQKRRAERCCLNNEKLRTRRRMLLTQAAREGRTTNRGGTDNEDQ